MVCSGGCGGGQRGAGVAVEDEHGIAHACAGADDDFGTGVAFDIADGHRSAADEGFFERQEIELVNGVQRRGGVVAN